MSTFSLFVQNYSCGLAARYVMRCPDIERAMTRRSWSGATRRNSLGRCESARNRWPTALVLALLVAWMDRWMDGWIKIICMPVLPKLKPVCVLGLARPNRLEATKQTPQGNQGDQRGDRPEHGDDENVQIRLSVRQLADRKQGYHGTVVRERIKPPGCHRCDAVE